MKKSARNRIIVWAIVSSVLISLLITGFRLSSIRSINLKNGEGFWSINFKNGEGFSFDGFDILDDYSEGGAQFDASEIKSLDIDWYRGDIRFVDSDDDKIKISEDGEGSKKMRWKLGSNGTLHIRYDGVIFAIFYIDNSVKTLTVSVPKGFRFEDVDIDTAGAAVQSDRLNTSSLNIDGASADVTIEKLSADSVDIDTASGSVILGGSVTNNLTINTVSGSSVVMADYKHCSIDSVSGDASIFMGSKTIGLNADTVSGHLQVLALESIKGFTAEHNSVSGSFTCDFSGKTQEESFVYGNGDTEISLESVSGDLSITSVKEKPAVIP